MAGKPHTHPVTHPDYTPGVFPSVYRKSHDKSDASRFNRHLKRIQQAKLRQWEGERSKEQEDDRQEEQESLQCTVDEDMDEDFGDYQPTLPTHLYILSYKFLNLGMSLFR